ncbi:MAG: tautomerase family protein [Chitinophagales bacterium]
MPQVRIEILSGKSLAYKKSLLDGVHRALVDLLKIPESDRFQRLYEWIRNALRRRRIGLISAQS